MASVPRVPVALSIAGSDPSGGAGVQADLKTFHQHAVYGAAAITLLTVQNTVGVQRVAVCEPELVRAQVDAVLEDLPVAAVKTGALGSAAVVTTVAARLRGVRVPVVVDPVMISKHGAPLLDEDARAAVRGRLVPTAGLLTPNAAEAASLTGLEVRTVSEAKVAARRLLELGAAAVLVKGGHVDEGGRHATDVLAVAGGPFDPLSISGPRVDTDQTHGTGCTTSAAIAARLALGDDLETAVRRAKAWLTLALRRAPGIGHGIGPVDHLTPMIPSSDGEVG